MQQDLEALQLALHNTVPNPFVTVSDDIAQELPIIDIAIAVCEASVDAFITVSAQYGSNKAKPANVSQYYRLRLSAFTDPARRMPSGGTEDDARESSAYLTAGARHMY